MTTRHDHLMSPHRERHRRSEGPHYAQESASPSISGHTRFSFTPTKEKHRQPCGQWGVNSRKARRMLRAQGWGLRGAASPGKRTTPRLHAEIPRSYLSVPKHAPQCFHHGGDMFL